MRTGSEVPESAGFGPCASAWVRSRARRRRRRPLVRVHAPFGFFDVHRLGLCRILHRGKSWQAPHATPEDACADQEESVLSRPELMSLAGDRSPHPYWCDSEACATYAATVENPAFVLHAAVIHVDDGRVVELLQREVLDSATGRAALSEPPRVIVTCRGSEELNVYAERAAVVGAALSRAAALLQIP